MNRIARFLLSTSHEVSFGLYFYHEIARLDELAQIRRNDGFSLEILLSKKDVHYHNHSFKLGISLSFMVKDYRRKMVDYFKKNLGKGYTVDALRFSLMNQGYSRAVIEAALETAQMEIAASAPILNVKPVIKHEIFDDEDNVVVVKKPWWRIFSW